ncbi:hypothetical protein PYCCODRAFT_1426438 [Trametes coccinea BRFM310]|uniref:Uncharacterized protein n=1 Tax=Trametes coccinea (strain BRFM310) TaxID=1353009 RepID=A0A1Y2IL22_TRAC3|nr:hypothetical protein PYCCODRAFT_1426438 [Trametes coccinea BRFM310]
MRFPRLSHLFHRRAKSEPELSRLASAPTAAPTTRRSSDTQLATSLGRSNPTSALSDVFTAYVPPAPLAFTTFHSHQDRHGRDASLESPFYVQPSGPTSPSRSIVSVLKHRICDLEDALKTERESYEAALQANEGLVHDVAVLQSEVLDLRRELFSLLADSDATPQAPRASHSGDALQFQALAAENAALAAECERLRRFVEILRVTESDAQPVLASAYTSILDGDEPEAALVAAIKRTIISQPDSVWRELLEPVTGVRTQDEYLAQVRCTLDARAHSRDWRKKAAFWKRAAREDGRHRETITPSASALSETVDVLPPARQQKVEEMRQALREGKLPLRVSRLRQSVPEIINLRINAPAATGDTNVPGASVPDPLAISPTALSGLDIQALAVHETSCDNDSVADPLTTCLPASSSSMVLPSASSSATVHSNLPPLASETFRASHSIKSVSSRGSSRSFPAKQASPPSLAALSLTTRSLRESIPASASASTQDSAKSRRRRAKIIAVPVTSASVPDERGLAASTTKSTSRWSFFGPSRSVISAVASIARDIAMRAGDTRNSGEVVQDAICDVAPTASGSGMSDPASDTSVETTVADQPPKTPSRPPASSLPKALLDFNSSPEDDLVLVLHSDFSGSSYRATPSVPPPSPTPGANRSPSSAHTTPEKRSRLPVRMPGLKAIKRFSASIHISRPVLVETTNAATFGFPVVPSVVGGGKEVGGGLQPRGRAPSVLERPGLAGASPPRPSKIPMGRKLQRFALGA